MRHKTLDHDHEEESHALPRAVVLLAAIGVSLLGSWFIASRMIEGERKEREAAYQTLRDQVESSDKAWERAFTERLAALDHEHVGEIERRFLDLSARIQGLTSDHEGMVSRDEVDALRGSMAKHTVAIDGMLNRDDELRRVLEHHRRGVGLIFGVYTFHIDDGKKLTPATLKGKPIRMEYSGTGFLVSSKGHVVSNRHVVEPWFGNNEVRPLLTRGLIPRLDRLTIAFPGKPLFDIDKTTIRVSPDDVDIGIFRVNIEGVPWLPLSTKDAVSTRGRRVTVLGYPTGLTAMLARAERDEVAEVLKGPTTSFELLAALSKRNMIWPVITQGTVNDVRTRRLIYDALTTSGGSGGPVFGPEGTVVGVNFAITRGFDGANFGVPIRYARALLPAK